MDLFNERADDKAVAYLVATLSLMTEWVMELTVKMMMVIYTLHSRNPELAETVRSGFLESALKASDFIDKTKANTGASTVYVKGLVVESFHYDAPHNLSQKELFNKVLDAGAQLPLLVNDIVKNVELAMGEPAPKEFFSNMEEDIRTLLDNAISA